MRIQTRYLVLAFAIVLGLISAAAAAADSKPVPTSHDVVEEVRWATLPDGLVIEKQVLIDRAVVADPAGLADTVTGIPRAASDGFTAQYVANAWRWGADQLPVRVWYNPDHELRQPAPVAWINAAVVNWSNVTSTFRFAYAGLTTAEPGLCDNSTGVDGVNAISFSSKLPSGTLGLTCTTYTTQGRAVEFDMQLSSAAVWGANVTATQQEYDLPSTILHEMGHAAGLGHSTDASSVMYFAIAKGQMKRTLTQDDIDGLRAQYPGGTPPVTGSPIVIPPFNRRFHIYALAVSGG